MDSKENSKSVNACSSAIKVETKDSALLKKYIIWENISNICWLDASMALVAHNKVMKRYSQVSPNSKINRIISVYDDVISMLNNSDVNDQTSTILAKTKLKKIQGAVFQYLQPILKYKIGDPESAFCSLYNLLIQDPTIKSILEVTWISTRECTSCGHHSDSTKKKPIITLSKIDYFVPENPSVLYQCACDRSNQKIKLAYVSLPPCLIFHFENGAGKQMTPLSFIIEGREYQLTATMILEKSKESNMNHFVTWIRDPSNNYWLDCNDLITDIKYFSPNLPDFQYEDVYMYVYESFDDLGTITINKNALKVKRSAENIPCIDISEESDCENSSSQSNLSEPVKNTGKMEISSTQSQFQDDVSSKDPVRENKSPKIVSEDKKNTNALSKRENFSDNLKTSVYNDSEEPTNMISGIFPNKNTETANSWELKTTLNKTLNMNLIADNDDTKCETDGSICKSGDCENSNFKMSELYKQKNASNSKANRILKQIKSSSITNDKSKMSLVDSSVKIQGLFVNSPVSKEKTTKQETSDIKISGNLVSGKHTAEKKNSADEMNSEPVSLNSNLQLKTDEKLILSSPSQQQRNRKYFVARTTAISSDTSYVKLSLPRKKLTAQPVGERKLVKNTKNVKSDDSFFDKTIDNQRCSKSLKRTREIKEETDEDSNYSPRKNQKKKQKTRKTSRDKMSSLIKVKAKQNYFPEQDFSETRTVSEAETSKINCDKEGMVLDGFEDEWSSHKPNCNCELAEFKEIIDTVVDFSFAYLCRLKQKYKQSTSH